MNPHESLLKSPRIYTFAVFVVFAVLVILLTSFPPSQNVVVSNAPDAVMEAPQEVLVSSQKPN